MQHIIALIFYINTFDLMEAVAEKAERARAHERRGL